MLPLRSIVLAVGLGLSPCAPADGVATRVVGHALFEYVGTADAPPLRGRLWYPAVPGSGRALDHYDRAFKAHAFEGARPQASGTRRPLVLLSHGDGGSSADLSWLAERLAGDGFIVAALSHWKNTWRDKDPAMSLQVWNRPRDLSALLNALLSDLAWASHIDPQRIGVAGFSSGGYAALALVGAVYSPLQMGSYCAQATEGLDCQLSQEVAVENIDWLSAGRSYRDDRIRAAFAMAPALGPGIMDDSLKSISIPVALVAAENDEFLPIDRNADRFAQLIPTATLTRLSSGGHFVFMPECTTGGKMFTFFHRFDICGRKAGLVRAPIHAAVAQQASRFFQTTLSATAPVP